MTGSQIIITIAVILFARLGIRLWRKYQEIKHEEQEETSSSEDQEDPSNQASD